MTKLTDAANTEMQLHAVNNKSDGAAEVKVLVVY